MPAQLWVVVGGGDKGGIVVREGRDTASALAPERLHTGSVLKELALEDGRLCYETVRGGGPRTGWVSIRLADGRDLVLPGGDLWVVVGGGDKGGILIRKGKDTASEMEGERLPTGAVVRQLALEDGRLQFSRLAGSGPATGWASVRLSDKELLSKVPKYDGEEPHGQPLAGGVRPVGEPLEIRASNEEKGFSYEGLPTWVPRAAAVARLWREGRPYLPTPEEPLARLALVKTPPPFKKLLPKALKAKLQESLPGDVYGLPFPRTAAQVESGQFGADWFTKAFHAAGTLPGDNRVARVARVKELNFSGFQKEGGAAMKMFIDVEYEKPDPALHTRLFAKYTYDTALDIPGQFTIGQDDAPEVLFAATTQHLLPFHTPEFYYADVCRETSAFIIITACIPYGKREAEEESKPYDILPGCGKCQDYLLPNPVEFYFALFRAMGQMGAWDHLGRFELYLGPFVQYDEAQFLSQKRPAQTKATLDATTSVVGKTLDKAIDFILNWCVSIAPAELRDEEKLQRVKSEMLEMCPYFKDMSDYFQANNSDWLAANHANLQADNAYFWRDEYGDLTAGVLDWGGFRRSPFCVRFLGCLSGADATDLLGHLEAIFKCYADEYARCGGPTLRPGDIVRRYHLGFITSLFDQYSYAERHTMKESTREEMRSFTGPMDPSFQERFYSRCGTLPMLNAWTYYVRKGSLKALFDEWASGDGKPYLTQYE